MLQSLGRPLSFLQYRRKHETKRGWSGSRPGKFSSNHVNLLEPHTSSVITHMITHMITRMVTQSTGFKSCSKRQLQAKPFVKSISQRRSIITFLHRPTFSRPQLEPLFLRIVVHSTNPKRNQVASSLDWFPDHPSECDPRSATIQKPHNLLQTDGLDSSTDGGVQRR